MMSKEESLLWDNDPFALPKNDATKLAALSLEYRWMRGRGVDPASPESVLASKGNTPTYAAWLIDNPKS